MQKNIYGIPWSYLHCVTIGMKRWINVLALNRQKRKKSSTVGIQNALVENAELHVGYREVI